LEDGRERRERRMTRGYVAYTMAYTMLLLMIALGRVKIERHRGNSSKNNTET